MEEMGQKNNKSSSVFFVLVITLLGKFFGFFREQMIAYKFGATATTDAFYLVNGLISSCFAIISVGLSKSFLPSYVSLKSDTDGERKAAGFASAIQMVLIIGAVFVALTMIVLPEIWVKVIAPNLDVPYMEMTKKILQIMAPILILYVPFTIRKTIMQANKQFAKSETSGIPYSVAIVCITLLLGNMGYTCLPIAALLGVVLQYLVMFFLSKKSFRFSIKDAMASKAEVKKYFMLIIPILLGCCFDEFNSIFTKALATVACVGGVSYLNYSMTITNIINGLFIYSITTVYFTYLSEDILSGNKKAYYQDVNKCFSMTAVVIIPVMFLFFVNADIIIRILFERGEFLATDTKIVSDIFRVQCIGCLLYAFRVSLRNFYYAKKDTKTPMINEIIALIITMGLSFVFVNMMKKEVVYLAIASVLATSVLTVILFFAFYRSERDLVLKKFYSEGLKAIASTVCCGGAFLIIKSCLPMDDIINCIISSVIAVFVYMGAMVVLRSEIFKEILGFMVTRKR